MSMNRVCLMGRIGRDLELKKTNSGVSVVSFPLAVDRNGKEGGTGGFAEVSEDESELPF